MDNNPNNQNQEHTINYEATKTTKVKANKKKKPFFKKPLFIIIAVIVVLFFVGTALSGDDEDENEFHVPEETTSEVVDAEPEPMFETIFEEEIYYLLTENDCGLIEINSYDEIDGAAAISIVISCANNDYDVENILEAISNKATEQAVQTPIYVYVMEKGKEDGESLVVVNITEATGILYTYTSYEYKSQYFNWVDEQFNSDGSHEVFNSIILDQLMYPDTYVHIQTRNYILTNTKYLAVVNESLAAEGYDVQLEIYDVFLQTQFTVVNENNETVTDIAYGYVDYDANYVNLIDIKLY